MSIVKSLALASSLFIAATAATAASYEVRQSRPDAGSNLRRVIGATSFPLDRTYEDMSEQERSDYRSAFKLASTADEPPHPVTTLKPLADHLARLQAMLQLTGELLVTVHVGTDGSPKTVSVVKSPNPDFERLVVLTLMDARYSVPKCAGQACEMDLPFSVTLHR